MKIKVDDKMYKRFLEIINEYDEIVFGSDELIKEQLEICLNTQGYWSGCSIRIYYDEDTKDFYVENRF